MPTEPDHGTAQRRAVMDPILASPAAARSPAADDAASGVFRSAELTESAVRFMKQQPSEVNTAARLLKVWVCYLQAQGLLRQELKPLSFVAEMLAVCGHTRLLAVHGRHARASLAAIVKAALEVADKLATPRASDSCWDDLAPSSFEAAEHTGGIFINGHHYYEHPCVFMMPRTPFFKTADLQHIWHCWGDAAAVLLHPVDPTDNLLEGRGWAEGGLAELGREAEKVLAVMEIRSLGELIEGTTLGAAYRQHCNRHVR
jgi:hypothetical protein